MLTGHVQRIFQNMPSEFHPVIAKVVSTQPLKISINNDSKLSPSENSIILCQALTDYTVEANVEDGNLLSSTGSVNVGDHGSHSHNLSTFKLSGTKITIKNHLKVGDLLFGLYFKGQYILIDRVVGK